MKLWEKSEASIDQLFEKFTIGNDPLLDLKIARYDVIASKAHVNMLGSIQLLTDNEKSRILDGLDHILEQIDLGEFQIEPGIEDCHSQIELQLTRDLGEAGKKIHSGRSRNDQVLVALKLYAKDQLEKVAQKTKDLFELLLHKSESNKEILMPGYTHMQVAMPSSFGLWFGAYAESLIDDLVLIKAAHQIADKNPLGSAAGYGSSFPLDRDMTTGELGFATLNYNSIYAQMTRGKTEKASAVGIASLASTLSKFCMDVCLYSGQEYGFFMLDKNFTTGSSIMPHKHNPDGFELVRAKCNRLQSLPVDLGMVLVNLPSGYHRDLQVLKESFISGFECIIDCIDVLTVMTSGLEPNSGLIDRPAYDFLFTVEDVNKAVMEGIPFRDAYKKIGEQVATGKYKTDKKLAHTHLGSIGNLANHKIKENFMDEWQYFEN